MKEIHIYIVITIIVLLTLSMLVARSHIFVIENEEQYSSRLLIIFLLIASFFSGFQLTVRVTWDTYFLTLLAFTVTIVLIGLYQLFKGSIVMNKIH